MHAYPHIYPTPARHRPGTWRATPSFHGVPAFRLAWATGRTVSRVALIPIQVCGLSQLNHVEKDGPGPVQLAAASHVPPHLSFFFFFQKEIQKLPNSELEFDRKSHLGQNLFFSLSLVPVSAKSEARGARKHPRNMSGRIESLVCPSCYDN
jgi:hypothetical protein